MPRKLPLKAAPNLTSLNLSPSFLLFCSWFVFHLFVVTLRTWFIGQFLTRKFNRKRIQSMRCRESAGLRQIFVRNFWIHWRLKTWRKIWSKYNYMFILLLFNICNQSYSSPSVKELRKFFIEDNSLEVARIPFCNSGANYLELRENKFEWSLASSSISYLRILGGCPLRCPWYHSVRLY